MIPTVGFNMRKVSKGNVTIKVSVVWESMGKTLPRTLSKLKEQLLFYYVVTGTHNWVCPIYNHLLAVDSALDLSLSISLSLSLSPSLPLLVFF